MDVIYRSTETLINGLSLGGVYALIALGYTMVYGIAKMLNFAHGDIIMVGGYVIYLMIQKIGATYLTAWPPLAVAFLSMLIAMIACAGLGMLIEASAYKPLRGASPLAVLITAIGVSYLLQSLAQLIFGSAPKVVTVSQFDSVPLFGDVSVNIGTLITLGVSIAIMAALTLFIKLSNTGRAMLAVSEDRNAAQLMGVNVNKIITVTFAIGSILAAVASFFYLVKTPSVSNTMGAMPGIKAFTAAVIGGIGSIPGAMIGGLLLGVIECIFNGIPAVAPYTDAIEFGILILILLVRPNGILGKKRGEKV